MLVATAPRSRPCAHSEYSSESGTLGRADAPVENEGNLPEKWQFDAENAPTVRISFVFG